MVMFLITTRFLYPIYSLILGLILLPALSGCSTYDRFKYITEDLEIPARVFKVDFNQSWEAVIQIMKRFDLAYQNLDAGMVRTKWIDNTSELNFSDAFASQDMVKGAKFKLIVSVVREYRMGAEVSKITISKRQLIEQDFLQGWKEIPSDNIMEQTLLYRIERIIRIDHALRALEEEKSAEVRKRTEGN